MLRGTLVFVASFMLTSAPAQSFAAHAKGSGYAKESDHTYLISSAKDFTAGTRQNITIDHRLGDGVITLKKSRRYATEGTFVSPEMSTEPFEYLIASWNSDTPAGTYVEIQVRAHISHYNTDNQLVKDWSTWRSWGKWGTNIARASVSDLSDPLAYVDVDTFTVRGSRGETADKFQIKAILHSDNPRVAPSVRLLSASTELGWNSISQHPSTITLNKDIDTPDYSQMIRDPKIANSICSPTTITMAMNRMGENLLLEETALRNYDYDYEGFGNWAFSTALAGSYGYKSYSVFTDIDGLKREIAKGYPAAVSVKYTNDPTNTRYPYVEGAPGTTPGHLILVRGFETIDGQDYVIVNDSFAPSDDTAVRKYRADQFQKAWANGVAYIVRDKERGAGYAAAKRVRATLRPTKQENEYALYAGFKKINIPANFTADVSPLTEQSGTLAYTISDGEKYDTDAHKKFYYTHETEDGNIVLNVKQLEADLNGKHATLTLYVLSTSGDNYVATLDLNKKMHRR
ncbi:C39 family peptidase [Sporolactobacillus shoreicorticis]|uniref:C39 family peptidase n=1 Tax=Sporolactobacillus shoreicorticis TaxID=1923877 RepID=A0ABW5S4Z7_9BACL|nr:C39 family peptidase [Sporolactobacillus shoreicorticis]MCO7124454.1 C39 family peptidase [Sporolactobacillus shoreicorticis]